MPRRSRRRQAGSGWGKPLLIIAVLLLALGGWWWQRGHQVEAPAQVDAPAARADGRSEQSLALPPVESTGIGDQTPPAASRPPPAARAPAPAAPSQAGVPAFLPPEAAQTLQLIRQGGPFPHRQDGSVFANREGRLPRQPRGYYHEYTVDTPGLDHRGARRIVTGGNPPAEFYYTDDHYDSFRRFETGPTP